MLPNLIVSLCAQMLKSFEFLSLLATHHIGHFFGEDERCSLSIETEFSFEIAQKVSKINMKEVTHISEHDVAAMAIPDAENVGGNTIASARSEEVLDSILEVVFSLIFGLEVLNDGLFAESTQLTCILVNIWDGGRLKHNLKSKWCIYLYHTNLIQCRNHSIGFHSVIGTKVQPNLIHDLDELQGEQILADVIATLVDDSHLKVRFYVLSFFFLPLQDLRIMLYNNLIHRDDPAWQSNQYWLRWLLESRMFLISLLKRTWWAREVIFLNPILCTPRRLTPCMPFLGRLQIRRCHQILFWNDDVIWYLVFLRSTFISINRTSFAALVLIPSAMFMISSLTCTSRNNCSLYWPHSIKNCSNSKANRS